MTNATATMAPAVGILYKTVVTHANAKRDAKNNLLMKFRLNHQKREALFSCAELEHVGDHQPRKVQFTASDDCILHFDNINVFGILSKELTGGEAVWLGVLCANNEQTTYWVESKTTTTTAGTMGQTATRPAPPVIVVP